MEAAWHPSYSNGGFLKGADLNVVQTPGSVYVSGASLGNDQSAIYRFTFTGRTPERVASVSLGPEPIAM